MFSYYFKLGVRSLRRNPALTALMILTLAVGVAASVSTLTILHMMSGNPVPHKSSRLLVPLVDNGPVEGYTPRERPWNDQLSYKDATNLLASGQGERRTVVYGTNVPVEPERKDLGAFDATGLAHTRDFFAMFEAPFRYGQPWGESEDKAAADVVVLSRELSERLFGDIDPVGKRVTLSGSRYQVVGVLDKWKVIPRYYRLIGGPGAFGAEYEFYIPFATAIRKEYGNWGSTSCNGDRGPGFQGFLDSECVWLQFWFETAAAGDRDELQDYLDSYAAEQRKLGRLMRNAPNKLYDVMEWLEFQRVVGNDSRLAVWLSFGFLLLCLVNTMGLLLAKFSARAAEVGIRRSLGASRRDIFQQFLVETGVIGLAGGVLGLLLAFGSLALIGSQSKAMATVAQMDWIMLGFTFLLAVSAAVLAGLLPTWRACQVTPAVQLKSQ
ncbi:MAG TPA: ABC transporter permease [Telluria sp.]